MGYYIDLDNAQFTIRPEHFNEALTALHALNYQHELKQGGSYPVKGDSFEDRWFSWMPPRYHETTSTPAEVFEQLGFSTEVDADGLHLTGYSNKTGQEELFLEAVAPWVVDGSYLEFRGEDGSQFGYTFTGGKMQARVATTTWS